MFQTILGLYERTFNHTEMIVPDNGANWMPSQVLKILSSIKW